MGQFTDTEIDIAKSVDLVDLAESVQIPLKRKGRFYYVDGMDSAMIFNRSSWYRYSRGVGGSTIDFLMYFKDMEFKEAVSYLLDFAGYIKMDVPMKQTRNRRLEKPFESKPKEKEKVPFILPEKSRGCRGLYAYLTKRRKLSQDIINHWLKNDLMYESQKYHNIVFLGKSANGEVKFASQRGIHDMYGKPFKGDVPGNDKKYGVNLIPSESQEINVYEAAIDAMSDMDFRKDYKTGILALGMVSDGPLQTVLEEHPDIKTLNFCLDNDGPGRKAAKKLARKYVLEEYEVFVRLPPFGKDYNFFLQCERENRSLWEQVNRIGTRTGKDLQEPERLKEGERKFLHIPESVPDGKQIFVNTMNVIPQRAAAR